MDTSTLCYPQRSKNYKYLKAEVYRQETAALLDILERCKTGMQQLAVIITMNDITVRSSRYGDRGFGSWGSRIHNTLLRSVEEYGKKAAPLSAKQLEIVCRDFQTRWQRERQFDDSLSA